MNGADARKLTQALIVLVVGERGVGLCLDLMALPDQAASFGDDHAEHADGWAIEHHGQADRRPCGQVDIADKTGFCDLLANYVPGR